MEGLAWMGLMDMAALVLLDMTERIVKPVILLYYNNKNSF